MPDLKFIYCVCSTLNTISISFCILVLSMPSAQPFAHAKIRSKEENALKYLELAKLFPTLDQLKILHTMLLYMTEQFWFDTTRILFHISNLTHNTLLKILERIVKF